MCAIAARLSCRAHKYTPEMAQHSWTLSIVQGVPNFSFSELKLLMRIIVLCLAAVFRNVTVTNLKRIMRRIPRFLSRDASIQSEVFILPAVKHILLNNFGGWCKGWEQSCRLLGILDIFVYSEASHST